MYGQRYAARPYARPEIVVSSAPATVIKGWQNESADVYLARPQRLSFAPGFVSTFKTAAIAGIPWSGPRDHAKIPPAVSSGLAPAIGNVPTAAANTTSGIAWFEPPDRDRPATKIYLESLPAAFVSTFKTAPISGMAWFTPLDWAKAKVSFDNPSAFALRPPTGTPISGIGWFEPPDRDKRPVKINIEALPALALTPSTLPVPIRGMAWFEPPDRDQPAFKFRYDAPPAYVRFPVSGITITLGANEGPDMISFSMSFRDIWVAATKENETWTPATKDDETWTPK